MVATKTPRPTSTPKPTITPNLAATQHMSELQAAAQSYFDQGYLASADGKFMEHHIHFWRFFTIGTHLHSWRGGVLILSCWWESLNS